jgi:hypothetical protein
MDFDCGFYISYPSSLIHIVKITQKTISYYEFVVDETGNETGKYKINKKRSLTSYEDLPTKNKIFLDNDEIYIKPKYCSRKYFKSNNFQTYLKIDNNNLIL